MQLQYPPSLGSDNHSGIHPEILKSIIESNHGSAPSYGMDHLSQELRTLLKTELGCLDNYIVFNGTAANVLSIASSLKSYESVLCADISHLNVDECAAPEKFFGGKLIPTPSKHGKISIDEIKQYLIRRGDQHHTQIKMISITQPTEYGTLYSLDEINSIKEFCQNENLYLHIDGARIANAAYRLNCSIKDILSLSDIASFGGSKNGLFVGDLVLIYNPNFLEGFKFLRKQALQLPSKSRFIACQFLSYFKNNLWLDIAEKQCQMADYLASQLTQAQVEITQPVQSNAVFCLLPKSIIKELKKDFFFYVWDEISFECRLMTSFDTTKDTIDNFIDKLTSLRG